MNDNRGIRGYEFNSADYENFLGQLREKEREEIENMLLRYSLYRPEMAEAAIVVAAEKGIITSAMKENILNYAGAGFTHTRGTGEKRWARSNPFREYMAGYSDARIYDILENPGDIARDVYRALLEIAVGRKLIEAGESDRLLREARRADMTWIDRRIDISDEVFNDVFFSREKESVRQAEVVQDEYWMCPSCGETVGMNLAKCWNCQSAVPENPVHPVKEQVIREVKSERISKTPGRMGSVLVICGIGGFILSRISILGSADSFGELLSYHPEYAILSGLVLIIGIAMLVYNMFRRDT